MKKPQPLHLENSQSLQKSLIPSEKVTSRIEVTPRTLPMRKSQFQPFRNNLKPSWKNLNIPEKFLPPSPPRENCLTITETTSNNRTKSQPLPKNPNP